MIQDSGTRKEFSTGAVRDIREGKGRCDLLPLDVVADIFDKRDMVITDIHLFQKFNSRHYLFWAIHEFCIKREWNIPEMLLELSKHFEEGAKKYGERNWEKGLPVNCYIDSAVRHYLKWLRGDKDERHDRAFCWNIVCCIWTVEHEKSNENTNSSSLD